MTQWPENLHHAGVNDIVHGSIEIPRPINSLIDTEEFQRLRDLKQTGIVNRVYPSCTHTRFEHSLGAYHLAKNLLDRMRSREPHLNITSEDHLCVCIAALLHDIGHGPHSHLFDGPFAAKLGKSWKHEDMSMRIVERLMIENEKVRREMEKFLSTGQEYRKNVNFIKEMIGSKRFTQDIENEQVPADWDMRRREEEFAKLWDMKGRGVEKSFLYDIVSNTTTGHDVDKMDYLLRDSKLSGVPIALNLESINRLLNNLRVVIDEKTGIRRIGYYHKVRNDIKVIGDSRLELHDKVYQHKAVRGMELLLIEAMYLASPYLNYKGSHNRMFKLHEVTEDVEAFLKTSDTVIDEIKKLDATNCKAIQEAQYLLKCMDERATYKKMGFVELSPMKIVESNDLSLNKRDIISRIELLINQKLQNEFVGKFRVLIRDLGRGIGGDVHPIEREVFYSDKEESAGNEIPIGFRMESDYVDLNCSQTVTKWELFVMGERSIAHIDRKRIDLALREAAGELQLVPIMSRKRNHSIDDNRNIARRRLDSTTVLS
ncbi:unnamed protein product [Caenorhabditis angaria]|uniref:HD/PDEase domain-containing protein n=1 Tax=Caenorhabditis angaria TaxID=860376 RepID=A0A9P1MYM3_9PELO|nr:unnamed protein product [Caenorhabditis angaria]